MILLKSIYLAVFIVMVLCTARDSLGALTLTFSCKPDNDIYNILKNVGHTFPRYDNATAAINAAANGSGVLILASNYPSGRTSISTSDYNTAQQKNLKLYVEYPSSLPGVNLGGNVSATVQRAVVSSDFFGSSLPAMSIISVNQMNFIGVTGINSHMVAAQVAGFDRAVYGLPGSTNSLLFETSNGNVLASMTQLSHFVQARYAPQDALNILWTRILTWLQPGETIPTLTWAPVVRPQFSKTEPLPNNGEANAINMGAEWYFKSKLLLAKDRVPLFESQVSSAGGISVPSPAPDSPEGDGTFGLLEAMMAQILPDGSQLQSIIHRGDCNAEGAFGLAAAGAALDNTKFSQAGENLMDFVWFNGGFTDKEFNDPNSSAWGLTAWGITNNPWWMGSYGDDNARVGLAAIGVSGLLKSERWDEELLKMIFANFRLTSTNGFRPARINLPQLAGKDTWKNYHSGGAVDLHPHYVAYLWPVYLWAYEQTKYAPFLNRTKEGIRRMMAAYPNGWRWTNGIAQEKARMLLPLAWLVRVEDIPQHRTWLKTMFDDVVAIQDESGGIQEELGEISRGQFPPPQSNSAYGHGEASAIQENGDKVSDMLYTTNFAFLGMHEAAAATNDPAYVSAVNKLAEFLIRVQTRSNAQPTLDGAWFRAFDFGRWEPWGSNADAGWGAWATETGWTQGWITGILALRQLNTSLWDISANSSIEKHFDKWEAILMRDSVLGSADLNIQHEGIGKTITLSGAPNASYPGANGASTLVDGKKAELNYTHNGWLGYDGEDVEVVIDLGVSIPIHSVAASFLQNQSVGIFVPSKVDFSVSNDNSNFQPIGSMDREILLTKRGPSSHIFGTNTNVSARYIRVQANNIGQVPSFFSANNRGWIFIDEVYVNADRKEIPVPIINDGKKVLSIIPGEQGFRISHVYDIIGNNVISFSSGSKPKKWNGKDDAGNKLENGIYFLKGKVNGKQHVRRVLISN